MIRLLALSFGTVTMVGAVLWGLDDRNTSDAPINQVSRSEPADLGLQPAVMPQGIVLSQAVKTTPAPTPAPVIAALKAETEALRRIRPVARPAGLGPDVQEAAAPATTISIQDALGLSPAAKPVPKAKPAPGPSVKDDAVINMSYGIIGAFQAQNAPAAPPKAGLGDQSLARIQALANQPVAPAPKPALRSYHVKEGDSLPGIAFRFYGTTVAYLDIINANRDLLTSPADLRAGMVLSIPEKN